LAFVQSNGGLRLSPFYDLLSTAIYKEISPKFSYNIGGQFLWYKLHDRHLTSFAQEIGISEVALKNSAKKLFEEVEKKLSENIKEFEARFDGVKTVRIIEKEIKKRMRYFRDKFKL
jgi:serine/threonine-protein kinase HipA